MTEKVRLPQLLSEGCVLQQGDSTRIWGWAAPKSRIEVRIQSVTSSTLAREDGRWETWIGPLTPGGPFEVVVASEHEILRRSCFIGEVMVFSGQSNMELPLSWVKQRYPEEFQREPDSYLRQYKIAEAYDFMGPREDHGEAAWAGCSNETVGYFSAVAYFAGRKLRHELGVPVGIINATLGGSPLESWMDIDSLERVPGGEEALAQLDSYRDSFSEEGVAARASQKSIDAIALWYADLHWDEADKTWTAVRAAESSDLAEFRLHLPSRLASADKRLTDFCGLVHLRRMVTLPRGVENEQGLLELGTLVDADRTYVNGMRVGSSEYQYLQRNYVLPTGILKSGVNEIAVSLVCERGTGRVTEGKPFRLSAGSQSWDLSGEWDARIVEKAAIPCPVEDFVRWKPTVLYNAMLAPCFPMTIRAVAWYQGESNAGQPRRYSDLLKEMIALWREKWGQPSLPFVVVQLPGFSIDAVGEDGGWSGVRAAQSEVAAELPGVVTVPTIDCGEWNDLHPSDKQPVGERVAAALLSDVYGRGGWNPLKLETCELTIAPAGSARHRSDSRNDAGGTTDSDTVAASAIYLTDYWHLTMRFGAQGTRLASIDGEDPGEFDFAWPDGAVVHVPARIDGNTVTIEVPTSLRKPEVVRYAWSNAPQRGLLYNVDDGVPIAPFEATVK